MNDDHLSELMGDEDSTDEIIRRMERQRSVDSRIRRRRLTLVLFVVTGLSAGASLALLLIDGDAIWPHVVGYLLGAFVMTGALAWGARLSSHHLNTRAGVAIIVIANGAAFGLALLHAFTLTRRLL